MPPNSLVAFTPGGGVVRNPPPAEGGLVMAAPFRQIVWKGKTANSQFWIVTTPSPHDQG